MNFCIQNQEVKTMLNKCVVKLIKNNIDRIQIQRQKVFFDSIGVRKYVST